MLVLDDAAAAAPNATSGVASPPQPPPPLGIEDVLVFIGLETIGLTAIVGNLCLIIVLLRNKYMARPRFVGCTRPDRRSTVSAANMLQLHPHAQPCHRRRGESSGGDFATLILHLQLHGFVTGNIVFYICHQAGCLSRQRRSWLIFAYLHSFSRFFLPADSSQAKSYAIGWCQIFQYSRLVGVEHHANVRLDTSAGAAIRPVFVATCPRFALIVSSRSSSTVSMRAKCKQTAQKNFYKKTRQAH